MRYNLIGKSFGNLTVVSKIRNGGHNNCQVWSCKCKCGNLIEKTTTALTFKRGKNNICCGRNCLFHGGKNSRLFKR